MKFYDETRKLLNDLGYDVNIAHCVEQNNTIGILASHWEYCKKKKKISYDCWILGPMILLKRLANYNGIIASLEAFIRIANSSKRSSKVQFCVFVLPDNNMWCCYGKLNKWK